jgi:hypothetical protein
VTHRCRSFDFAIGEAVQILRISRVTLYQRRKSKVATTPTIANTSVISFGEQERGAEIGAVRAALIEGEKSGKPKRFDASAFKRKLRRAHG